MAYCLLVERLQHAIIMKIREREILNLRSLDLKSSALPLSLSVQLSLTNMRLLLEETPNLPSQMYNGLFCLYIFDYIGFFTFDYKVSQLLSLGGGVRINLRHYFIWLIYWHALITRCFCRSGYTYRSYHSYSPWLVF